MVIKGLIKRWLINITGLILGIIIILTFCSFFIVQNYYYNSVYQNINGHASGAISYFACNADLGGDFDSTIVKYIENFQYKNKMTVTAYVGSQEETSTSGFASNEIDLVSSHVSRYNHSFQTGRLSSGEKIMLVKKSIDSGKHSVSLVYTVSLKNVDKQILVSTLSILAIAIIIIFVILISNSFFIKSIVTPVDEICAIAKKIAQGDFNSRIHKRYDDEIGNLCDTVNYMASELANAETMKNDFISSVSHELRTPLTAIKGWAETMKLSGSSDAQTMDKGLGIIIKESERLSGIVEELLDFSRMQNKSMVLMLEKIDLLAELDEAVYIYRDRAIKEGKHLVFDAVESLPPVLGDKNRLRQVFVNVIDNALKYTDANGTISINVHIDSDMVHIMISDDGCGIPAKHLPKIKDKFYKVNQTRRGSGIGLAVADEIMTLHSGMLNVESQEGLGTTVVISIPVLKEEQSTV